YANWLKRWREEGYLISLYYFWVRSPDLAVSRVANRVRRGGHNVPEATIRQRYERSMHNFFSLYRALADSWFWYDNTESATPRLIACGDATNVLVADEAIWQQILAQVNP